MRLPIFRDELWAFGEVDGLEALISIAIYLS